MSTVGTIVMIVLIVIGLSLAAYDQYLLMTVHRKRAAEEEE